MASLKFSAEGGASGSYDRLIDAKAQILHGTPDAPGETRLLPVMQFTLRLPFETGSSLAKWALAPASKGRFAKVTLNLMDRTAGETHTWELQKAYVHRLEEVEFPADPHNATAQENIILLVIRGVIANGEDYDGENALTMTSANSNAPAPSASLPADEEAPQVKPLNTLAVRQTPSSLSAPISKASAPSTTPQQSIAVPQITEPTENIDKEAELDQKIVDLLSSTERPKQLVGEVARSVRRDLQAIERKVGPNGSVGDVDVETKHAIIEVTVSFAKKKQQIEKLLNNKQMNPSGKPVILYAPNYNGTPAKDIEKLGATVVRNEAELHSVLKKLGGS